MEFRNIELSDKDIFEEYKAKSTKYNCDFCFTDIFLWKEYYETKIAFSSDCLFLRYTVDGDYLYSIPLGNTSKGIELLEEKIKNLKIINIEKHDLHYFNDDYIIHHIRNNDDYIYLSTDLASLNGKDYKSKRNQVNSFKSKYQYSVSKIRELKADDDFSILLNDTFVGEKNAITLALWNMDKLNLDGLVLKADGKIVALTIGTLEKDTFITHFEKVDYNYSGASQMINFLLANYIKEKATYINREEDLGIEGLRKAKLSYNPIKMIESYTAYYKC